MPPLVRYQCDLGSHCGHGSTMLALESTPPILPPDWHEQVEEILWEVIDFSGDGVSRRFLVRWQGRPSEDDAWISEADLERLRPDLLEPLPSSLANSS